MKSNSINPDFSSFLQLERKIIEIKNILNPLILSVFSPCAQFYIPAVADWLKTKINKITDFYVCAVASGGHKTVILSGACLQTNTGGLT